MVRRRCRISVIHSACAAPATHERSVAAPGTRETGFGGPQGASPAKLRGRGPGTQPERVSAPQAPVEPAVPGHWMRPPAKLRGRGPGTQPERVSAPQAPVEPAVPGHWVRPPAKLRGRGPGTRSRSACLRPRHPWNRLCRATGCVPPRSRGDDAKRRRGALSSQASSAARFQAACAAVASPRSSARRASAHQVRRSSTGSSRLWLACPSNSAALPQSWRCMKA
jgi:hypothetical protein